MDALTFPRLRASFRTPALMRKLTADMQRGGEQGRNAAERLGRSSVPRPEGPLLWCHVPGMIEAGALTSLRERLHEEMGGVSLLVTSPDVLRCREMTEAADLICQLPPLDAPRTSQHFLEHWVPDLGLWFSRVDAPILLESAARRGVPLFLQNAIAPEAVKPSARKLERRLLGLFQRVFTLDATEFEAMRALGSSSSRIEVSGRLARISHPPTCLESEREFLADAMRARPAWMAACPDESELPAILEAHQHARRTAHRLLLILVPRHEADGPILAEKLRADGWHVARRDADDEPNETTDIFIGDYLDEIGLYYRLAPVCFLGGTLSDTEVPEATHPATLGSAIISGPYSGDQAETLRRLRRGGACRLVADSSRLGAALIELLAPDKAAQLALNAWDIASDGSPVLDRLVSAILPVLKAERS